MNRLQISAALQNLIDGKDVEQSASLVIAAYKDVPKIGSRLEMVKSSSGDSVTGSSPGHGSITIEDKDRTKEIRFGREPERVGKFRIWRESGSVLKFCHYFGFELSTQREDGPPAEYVIGHHGNKFKFFGVEDEVTQRRFFFINVETRNLRLIVGERPLVWAPKIILSIGGK